MNYKSIALCALLCAARGTSAGTVDEERVVRSTYAMLQYAVDLEAARALVDAPSYSRWAQSPSARIEASGLSFVITDVRLGDFQQIEGRPTSDFIAPPEGDALAIATTNHRYVEGPTSTETWLRSAQPKWVTSPFARINWAVPLGVAVTVDQPGKRYSRYAHFTVALAYDHQTVSYRALFLFESDSDGMKGVRIMDPVTDVSALMTMLNYDPYPEAFIKGPHRSSRPIQEWLHRDAVTCDYNAGKGVCCDLRTLRCGMRRSAGADLPQIEGHADVGGVALLPMTVCPTCNSNPSIAPASGQDSSVWDHGPIGSGSHGVNWSLGGSCTLVSSSPTCLSNCDASATVWPWENGITFLYSVHQFAVTTALDHNRNVLSNSTCKGGVGYGVKGCFLPCGANLAVAWNGASLTVSGTDTVWNNAQQMSFTCQ